jgi:2-methylcitrate dehydratase PrpD
MSDYTVKLTETEQAGFDYQSSITGESVADMIQRRVSEIGMTYYHDLKRAKVQELMKKIETDPDAYVDAIAPIYDAQVAATVVEEEVVETP